MATLADDAVMESNRVDIALSGEPFVARGNRVVHAGWFEYYPYTRQKDLELPLLEKDDLVRLVDKQFEAKETQPPARFGQGTLIELMEKHNLGTKATRHAIIQNLYDRGYVRSNPVEPTEMGIKMAEALQDFRAAHRFTRDDSRAREGHGPHLGARHDQGGGGHRVAQPAP